MRARCIGMLGGWRRMPRSRWQTRWGRKQEVPAWRSGSSGVTAAGGASARPRLGGVQGDGASPSARKRAACRPRDGRPHAQRPVDPADVARASTLPAPRYAAAAMPPRANASRAARGMLRRMLLSSPARHAPAWIARCEPRDIAHFCARLLPLVPTSRAQKTPDCAPSSAGRAAACAGGSGALLRCEATMGCVVWWDCLAG